MKKLILIPIFLFSILIIGCYSNPPISNTSSNTEQSVPSISDSSFSKGEDIYNESPFDDSLVAETFSNLIEEDKNRIITVPLVDISQLDATSRSWFNVAKKDGTAPEQPKDVVNLLEKYSASYLGDTKEKEIYLTFNNGYENGNTSIILDTLKAHNVQASFFVLKHYITSNNELIKRIEEEGHLVVNHSASHKSMDRVMDIEEFRKELVDIENAYEEVTGKKMAKFFRPPSGAYNELTLYYAAASGYKTVFWSFAYDDWDEKRQYSQDYVRKLMMDNASHNGVIVMLHAVSNTNTEVLDEMISYWKDNGFKFKTLYELPHSTTP